MEENKNNYPEMDFQLNRWLMNYSKKVNRYVHGLLPQKTARPDPALLRPKRTMQDAIEERLRAPPLSEDWYRDIVERILREHSSNLSSLRNQVLVSAEHKQKSRLIKKLPQRYYTLLFNTYFIEMLFC